MTEKELLELLTELETLYRQATPEHATDSGDYLSACIKLADAVPGLCAEIRRLLDALDDEKQERQNDRRERNLRD